MNHTSYPIIVKVFRTNDENKWDEIGTGIFTFQAFQGREKDYMGLIVVDKDTNKILLKHRISFDCIYRMEVNIILWKEPTSLTQWALSFSDHRYCADIFGFMLNEARCAKMTALTIMEANIIKEQRSARILEAIRNAARIPSRNAIKSSPELSQYNKRSGFQNRVKLYRMNIKGKWDDVGTGLAGFDFFDEISRELGSLLVVDEDTNITLLKHHISDDDIYRKEEDTLIFWKEPITSVQWALSFQEPAQCTYIWDRIRNEARNAQYNLLANQRDYKKECEEMARQAQLKKVCEKMARQEKTGENALKEE
ncbi:hypothetical protein CASFOL_021702 [Castilleja foliolosa]|uniref:PP4R3 EVH1-like domain-containing protein n=1 Tax=Castilleja foliolosa TaxID=1961234 RepID=A0ABD3CXB3_9LAMI